jgi:hypothetical protein
MASSHACTLARCAAQYLHQGLEFGSINLAALIGIKVLCQKQKVLLRHSVLRYPQHLERYPEVHILSKETYFRGKRGLQLLGVPDLPYIKLARLVDVHDRKDSGGSTGEEIRVLEVVVSQHLRC